MSRLLAALACCLLAACAGGPPIDTSYKSVSQDSRVQFLVLHFTSSDFPSSLKILTRGPVSSHYLVTAPPVTIHRLVDERRRAHHAGLSSWRGHTYLNASSIGIEIVNAGFQADTQDWQDYPEEQVAAVIELAKDIARRHEIRPQHIVGHSDIAPQRKLDPGPRFPWKRLADAGLIPWPDADAVAARLAEFERSLPDVAWFQQRLARHGFAVPEHGELDEATRNVLRAFQMKYRPARHDGEPDAETAALLEVLTGS
jgi:N-acetylmuramoyl-L-alanine amidase